MPRPPSPVIRPVCADDEREALTAHDDLVGMLVVRHRLSPRLERMGGHLRCAVVRPRGMVRSLPPGAQQVIGIPYLREPLVLATSGAHSDEGCACTHAVDSDRVSGELVDVVTVKR